MNLNIEKMELLRTFFKKAYINEGLFNYLANSDFLVAPASTKYHGSYEGGLFDHSVSVLKNLLDFTKKLDLNWKKNVPLLLLLYCMILVKLIPIFLTKKQVHTLITKIKKKKDMAVFQLKLLNSICH